MEKSRSSSISSDASSVDESVNRRPVVIDPLSAIMEGVDPLSQLVAEVALSDARGSDSVAADKKGKDMPRGELDVNFEPWSSKRANILTKYTTSEKLSITTSFLTTSDKEKG